MTRPRPWWQRPFTGAALGLCALSVGAAFLPRLPLGLAIAAVFLAGLGALLAVIGEWSDLRPTRWQALVAFLGAAGLWTLTAGLLRSGGPWWVLHPANSVALVVGTLVLGTWLAAELERPGHLLPVCLIGGLADLWSVLAGPTRQIGAQTESHARVTAEHVSQGLAAPPPPWPSFLIYYWPLPGEGLMAPLVGFGDLVFLALLLAAARRFALPWGRSFGALVAGLVLSVLVSVVLERPVPALPAMCGLFVLGNLPALRLERREWWITAAAAVLLGGAVTVAALR